MKSSITSAVGFTTACIGLTLLGGCMQARIEESRELATPLAKGERVVILAKPQIEGSGAEDEFMDCIGENLGDESGLSVHDKREVAASIKEAGAIAYLSKGGDSEELCRTIRSVHEMARAG